MEREEVSIVIPVYNRADIVCRTLDSVAAQTWRPLHLIVVDNNSTDGSTGVVSRWIAAHERDEALRVTFLSESKPGASAARNRGLREVDGEHVIFFDSDDEMMPPLVEKAVNSIGSADLVYWKAELVGLDGARTMKPFHEDDLVRRQFYNSMLATQIYMVRTDFIRKIGGWEEDAPVWNDWELGVRIALASPSAVALPELLVRINAQRNSITGSNFGDRAGDWENTLDIVEKNISGSDPDGILTDMLDYRRVILAAHYRREKKAQLGHRLLESAIGRPGRSWFRRKLLEFIYIYTVAGGRGAYYMWR